MGELPASIGAYCYLLNRQMHLKIVVVVHNLAYWTNVLWILSIDLSRHHVVAFEGINNNTFLLPEKCACLCGGVDMNVTPLSHFILVDV